MTTRAGRSVTSVGKMAESAITENVEGGETLMEHLRQQALQ